MIEAVRSSAVVALVLAGLFFTFVSTVGILRLPDIYSRTHTASQADTLGAGLTLAGVALALGWGTTGIKTVLLLVFIFLTNPTAAHAISRAAHEAGVEPWTADDDRTDDDRSQVSREQSVPDRTPAADGGSSDPVDRERAADRGVTDSTDGEQTSPTRGDTGTTADGSTASGGDRR